MLTLLIILVLCICQVILQESKLTHTKDFVFSHLFGICFIWYVFVTVSRQVGIH